MTIQIRQATANDVDTIWHMIRLLANYQKHFEPIDVTPESLRIQMLSPVPPFTCLLAEDNQTPVGFALFHYNYSTWEGKPGIYIDDLFVLEEWRGHGIARLLMQELATIGIHSDCSRLELSVLNWNQNAIATYERLGGRQLNDWISYRFDKNAIQKLVSIDNLKKITPNSSQKLAS
jgi:ribosomal protein S18 acetylase RimI-like enzyme